MNFKFEPLECSECDFSLMVVYIDESTGYGYQIVNWHAKCPKCGFERRLKEIDK